MCGVVGLLGKYPVNYRLYEALSLLQHRGQDSSGIATYDKGRFFHRRGSGMVYDVFRQEHMDALKGNLGIAHVRYPTAGSFDPALAQPLYVNSPYGICFAHNGNLTNSPQLQKSLRGEMRHLNTDSDSEVLLNVFAAALQRRDGLFSGVDAFFASVRTVHKQCLGAYAVVMQIAGHGLLGFRDPYGIRPLILGQRETPKGMEYMMASESVALHSLGFEVVDDLGAGEAVFIDLDGNLSRQQCSADSELIPCIFEHIYLARPDSIMDGVSVYKARLRQGEYLAHNILKRADLKDDIDVVIPVPDTGRVSAQSIAQILQVPFREGLTKNRYVGRTFIMPDQQERMKSVRRKLTTIDLEFRGKNVLLVDDSIVRGTTAKQIVQMARDAGAKKVFLASAAPAIRYPNIYGIDMPAASELVAYQRSGDEVSRFLGVDDLIYQELDDLKQSSLVPGSKIKDFECSVFDGRYLTPGIDAAYLRRLANRRGDNRRKHKKKHAGRTSHKDVQTMVAEGP